MKSYVTFKKATNKHGARQQRRVPSLIRGHDMIEHILTLKPHINGATPRNRVSMERMLYAYGYTLPHYPVPAINNMAYELDEWIDRWQHGELNLQWAVEIN